MSSKLKRSPRIWKLAADLGLKPKADALTDIVGFCKRRVRSFLAEFPCGTLSDLLTFAAAKLDTYFIEIRTEEELRAVKQQFLDLGEIEFANLEDQLGPDVYAITFRRIAPRSDDRQFVSVIDCRGQKAWRSYFSKWHELAHLLTLTPQMRLKFCRTNCVAGQKDPEEAAMDVIAGAVGFLPDLVRQHAKGNISFEKIQELRAKLCPEASVQASLIGFTQSWPTPSLLLQADMAFRKQEKADAAQQSFGFKERPEPALRAVNITSNDAARELGLEVFRNMRAPKESVIHKVFSDVAASLKAVEDLGWWEASDGTSLPDRRVVVEARRFGADVFALITPTD